MSVANPPQPEIPTVEATLSAPATGFGAILGALAIIPIVFLVVFHAGAGYLSYQKFGNMGWAFLDFLFAYFYYPYYAFFLTGNSMQQPIGTTMMGGAFKFLAGKRR